MDIPKNPTTTISTKLELKVWETPELYLENMETITEGGLTINQFEPDDAEYAS